MRTVLRNIGRMRWAIVGAGLAAAIGCQGPRSHGPIRAIWVTRSDYRTAADVTQIMENCKQGGFNTVVFQVRGNGTVFYPSKLEPWAEQFGFASPGFDPLAVACDEAHKRDLELHAWVNVMPAWRGTKPPSNPDQLYNKRPEWFWYDQRGNRQPLSTFYVSLNPCLPEVRAYLVDVFREIVGHYDVDGLHLDYIRFPNEPPAIPAGSDIDYPRDARTLALYKAATGLLPDENKESWDRWRTDQVTELVRQIHTMMRWTRPRAWLTASVGAEYASSLRHFRDDRRWVEEGLLDAAFPMNYKPDLERFNAGLSEWLPRTDKVCVVPGLWFDGRQPVEHNVEVVRQQIQASVKGTGNFCVFSYASLFDSQDRDMTYMTNAEVRNRRAEEQKRSRELRRQALLPVTQFTAP